MSVLQDLYDSEINVSLESFWDSGWHVRLGDEANGFLEEENFDIWGQVEPWLIEVAIKHFPQSQFAERYRDGLQTYRTDGKSKLALVHKGTPHE